MRIFWWMFGCFPIFPRCQLPLRLSAGPGLKGEGPVTFARQPPPSLPPLRGSSEQAPARYEPFIQIIIQASIFHKILYYPRICIQLERWIVSSRRALLVTSLAASAPPCLPLMLVRSRLIQSPSDTFGPQGARIRFIRGVLIERNTVGQKSYSFIIRQRECGTGGIVFPILCKPLSIRRWCSITRGAVATSCWMATMASINSVSSSLLPPSQPPPPCRDQEAENWLFDYCDCWFSIW